MLGRTHLSKLRLKPFYIFYRTGMMALGIKAPRDDLGVVFRVVYKDGRNLFFVFIFWTVWPVYEYFGTANLSSLEVSDSCA